CAASAEVLKHFDAATRQRTQKSGRHGMRINRNVALIAVWKSDVVEKISNLMLETKRIRNRLARRVFRNADCLRDGAEISPCNLRVVSGIRLHEFAFFAFRSDQTIRTV